LERRHIITHAKRNMTTKYYETVYCTLQVEGIHSWPGCPFDEVAYLRVPHRHVFHIKAYKKVTHSDRDVEFIMLKHQLQTHLEVEYYDTTMKCCLFGAKSCEMLAKELIEKFDLVACDVNEDGENGAFSVDAHEDITTIPLSQDLIAQGK
jgi:hypothetical protein